MRDDVYFNWLINIVNGDKRPYNNYTKLLYELYSIEFLWIIDLDANRASFGNQLRDDFEYETGIEACKDGYCSILELLIALSMQSERLLYDQDEAHPENLFWLMIDNLKLYNMTNSSFNKSYIDERIDIFSKRKYNFDGSNGGLFVVKYPPKDLRKVEIWYQLNWFLSEKNGCDLRKIGGF